MEGFRNKFFLFSEKLFPIFHAAASALNGVILSSAGFGARSFAIFCE
jgi:hypothetical protein